MSVDFANYLYWRGHDFNDLSACEVLYQHIFWDGKHSPDNLLQLVLGHPRWFDFEGYVLQEHAEETKATCADA